MPSPSELTGLLDALCEGRVEFVLVGGLAAVSRGAPLATRDADIVHRRSDRNVDALLAVLGALHARYRGRPGPPLAPSRDALLGPGHHLLGTDLGPLDVLGAIEEGRDYERLLDESDEVRFGDHAVRVLRLESILRFKRTSPRERDRMMVPLLEATLRRKGEASG